jgi:hypothetical protein
LKDKTIIADKIGLPYIAEITSWDGLTKRDHACMIRGMNWFTKKNPNFWDFLFIDVL